MRLTKCPVCKNNIELDKGFGSMEIHDKCSVGDLHYSYFMNLYCTTVTVLDDDYDLETKEGLQSWSKKVREEGWEYVR